MEDVLVLVWRLLISVTLVVSSINRLDLFNRVRDLEEDGE